VDDSGNGRAPYGYANYGYLIRWANPGGDWLDANGTAQGGTFFSQGGASSANTITVDMTTLVQKWYANGNTGAMLRQAASGDVNICSRHGNAESLWPSLIINDGTNTYTAQCSCFASLNTSTVNADLSSTFSVDWNNHAVVQFTLPAVSNVVSAQMVLHTIGSIGGYQLGVWEARHPKVWGGEGTRELGIAAGYDGDANLSSHPAVLNSCDYTGGWESFYNLDGYNTYDASFGFQPDLGANGVRLGYPVGNHTAMSKLHQFTYGNINAVGHDELYFRYYIYFEPDYAINVTDGCKMPGLAGRYGVWNRGMANAYDASNGGNGGDIVTGLGYDSLRPSQSLSGFSMRGHATCTGMADLPQNPLPPQIPASIYAYWSEMIPFWGNIFRFGDDTMGWVNYLTDQWYCIEHRVKMNTLTGTPDVNNNYTPNRDGIVEGWVNGVKVFSRANLILRRHPDIHVDEVWLNHYHGGTNVVANPMHFRQAATVVSTQYVGPMGGRGALVTINRNTPYDINPCPAENTGGSCLWSGTPRGSNGFRFLFENFSGGIYCPGINSLVMWSGGEMYNGPATKFSFDTGLWSVASDLPTDIMGTNQDNDPHFNKQWGTFGGYQYDSGGPFGVAAPPHTYDVLCYLPPEWGGGPKGSLLAPTRAVYYQVNSTPWSVKCDLATGHWSPGSQNGSLIHNTGGGHSWVADPPNRRFLAIPGGASQYTTDRIFTLTFADTSGRGVHSNGPSFADVAVPRLPCQVMGANRTVLIAGGNAANDLLLQAYDADALDKIYVLNRTTPNFIFGSCIGMTYVPDTGEFWLLPAVSTSFHGDEPAEELKPVEALYRVIPPSSASQRFTGAWQVVRVPITGAVGYNPSGVWKRFMYYPPTKSLVWCSQLRGPVYSLRVA
jgi:hypothetical protein